MSVNHNRFDPFGAELPFDRVIMVRRRRLVAPFAAMAHTLQSVGAHLQGNALAAAADAQPQLGTEPRSAMGFSQLHHMGRRLALRDQLQSTMPELQ